jgi:FlaA1/EpsC-like NDP-sugar epimerase
VLDRVLAGGVDTIYHAAAYKHVGLVDANPAEGLRNNVLGARAVSAAAARHGVATCVLVSSDKAVRPTTIMGASKRLSELLFLAAAAGATRTVYSMVRFGNVLGSSGSVLPLFRRQLAEGGPLTITHPGMERYFMLIPEAAQLVIQAGAMAEGGEVFVLDMGQPVRIIDLARRMMALAGLSERDARHPDGDIAIRYVGLAPGEKLSEELLACGEAEASRHPRIRRMKEAAPDAAALEQSLILLLRACDGGQRGRIESVLRTIMADYRPPGAAAPAAIPAPRAQATESAAVPSS